MLLTHTLLKIFAINNFPWRTESQAGQLAGFSISHTSFHFRKAINIRQEETTQSASRGLPTEEVDENREVIPIEGEGDSLDHQSFREALFGWSWVPKALMSCSPSLRNGDSSWQFWQYTPFKHFHLTYYCITLHNFYLKFIFLRIPIKLFFLCRPWVS